MATRLLAIRHGLEYLGFVPESTYKEHIAAMKEVEAVEQALAALEEIAAMPRRLQTGSQLAANPLITGDLADKALARFTIAQDGD